MPTAAAWAEECRGCGRRYPLAAQIWHCPCGGLLVVAGPTPAAILDEPAGGALPWSMWRYRPALPPLPGGEAWRQLSLGEGMTPLVPGPASALYKLDFVMPTGSFKDRGMAILVAAAAGAGHRRVVEDSSGNAGASLAAYAARAGLDAEVFVPAGTSPGKVAAMAAHGATVRRVDGGRAGAASAARRWVEETGAFYASHVYQPLFTEGTKTVAFEIWEQLGRRLPGMVVVPAGNGTLALGAWLGFSDLMAVGLAGRVPAIVAVQPERCAPLAGLTPGAPTVAEGIAVADPPRVDQVLAAVRSSGGAVITAPEEAIAPAQRELARAGMWVEPTAAATYAGWRAGSPPATDGPVVLVLTGAGTKARGAAGSA